MSLYVQNIGPYLSNRKKQPPTDQYSNQKMFITYFISWNTVRCRACKI